MRTAIITGSVIILAGLDNIAGHATQTPNGAWILGILIAAFLVMDIAEFFKKWLD